MPYDFQRIEQEAQQKWKDQQVYKVTEDPSKEKCYVLDMFPYPSGAGLHVGHPLGYIASDIYARYKRHQGFNVLHPMGYDSFGLPAEQYAIQTGQHPAVTTEKNINRYREQLDRIGFSFDWSREVRTSDPDYYRWTQWIVKQIFNAWYNKETDRAEHIETLVAKFNDNGNFNVDAAIEENWWEELPVEKYGFPFGEHFAGTFTATDWQSMTAEQQQVILSYYRLTYLDDAMVNWCPALGTVLANDEIKDGLSERGGHPVVQKRMKQWMMRITAYADKLLNGLDEIDWSDALKEQQRNWIGRSEGAMVKFQIKGTDEEIQVFTTRPDTIFGVSFMVLAPEHELVSKITSSDQRIAVESYVAQAAKKSERDRQANVKEISGEFTGAYVIHPFTGEDIPVWIADYVLAGYGTGAVMAVPAGDERDHAFAQHFKGQLHIKPIFENVDVSEEACADKEAKLIHSGFLNGMDAHKAIPAVIEEMEQKGIGWGKVNFRLRDAVFSRQRFWGEPFPVYYENDVAYLTPDDVVELPPVDRYLPTEEGEPPLARAERADWKVFHGERMDYNTMPGWAGSSWYFLRYMDPHNEEEFCAKEKMDYWGQVDLYMGGAEHATGHLLYSRFWCHILYDLGLVPFHEPFKKLINQGMIQGVSSFVYRVNGTNRFVSKGLKDEHEATAIHADISLVDNGVLDVDGFRAWRPEFKDAEFVLEDGEYNCGTEVEKMSKSKYNVINPDELCDRYGADTLRCYEMFLGPIEQHKPWDTNGITGVHNFLRKLSRLFENLEDGEGNKDNLKSLHKTIKKVKEDIERYSFNTVVSALMICVNELTEQKCYKRSVLEPLVILLAPYAPHLAEELWGNVLGKEGSVVEAAWPEHNPEYLTEDTFEYPVSFNGKMRFKMEFSVDLTPAEIEAEVLAAEASAKYLEGKTPKKVIVVPKRIVNVVV
ncbi:MAG: leucine--tRNA ligase [Flavobacteriales bacterium]|nr:leucine--tRNA ligase [Flavobacteriales bacterium]